MQLFPGDSPDTHAERKAAKPDLEALVHLPTFPHYLLVTDSDAENATGFLVEAELVTTVAVSRAVAFLQTI